MTRTLLLAPTGSGKTDYAIQLARATSVAAQPVLVCVASARQAAMWRRRLAAAGGALGVHVLTFDRLVAACLRDARAAYTELQEPVQFRLIRTLVEDHDLGHYAPLSHKPGFVSVLQQMFQELKQALINPSDFYTAVADLDEPRLAELALLYFWYQASLQENSWADRIGLHWLALEQLDAHPHVGVGWPLLIVDGFDDFTAVQLHIFRILSRRVGQFTLLLTHSPDVDYPRFRRTLDAVQEKLALAPQPLPGGVPITPLRTLAGVVFSRDKGTIDTADRLTLLELPDQVAEVRAALRWLKRILVTRDDLHTGDLALLARDMTPYRPFVQQIAAEFGLPVHILGKQPLLRNPAVAALLDLFALMLPRGGEPALPRRQVIEAWRSPYFDWSWPTAGITLTPDDATQLERAALDGRVIGGLSQWHETFEKLAGRDPDSLDAERDDPRQAPPVGPAAAALAARFAHFTSCLQPPAAARRLRDYVAWLETLIGPDPDRPHPDPSPDDAFTLGMIDRIRSDASIASSADIAALRALKEVLRGLVWAEEALDLTAEVDYAQFVAELRGAVEAASYAPPPPNGRHLLVADANEVRGLSFAAVALIGLAEGVFPQTVREDPFLRDADRALLREAGLPLQPSTLSSERAYFYQTLGRARDALLLTRPRLAASGAEWEPSPFWQEVAARTTAKSTRPADLTPSDAASLDELLVAAARYPAVASHFDAAQTVAWQRVARAGQALRQPTAGHLHHHAADLANRYGADHVWSASRLETYRSCAYRFFIGSVLELKPREEPAVGVGARGLGTIYHDILEAIYRSDRLTDDLARDELIALVHAIAQPILDDAPAKHGFRETAWWTQTRAEIIANVVESVLALREVAAGFRPLRFEQWVEGQIGAGERAFRLHGVVDRIDVADDGRFRVIDYKLGGPSAFTKKAFAEGEKLQLPLYALAAREALGLGPIADGFYWHVTHAARSTFTLADFDGGVEGALDTAVSYALDVIDGVRRGHFKPEPPGGGCPDYCPAVAFCRHYRPRSF